MISRTWWTLHSIECVLTSITGRPRIIHEKDCTVLMESEIIDDLKGKARFTQQTHKNLDGSDQSASSAATQSNFSASLDTFLDSWIKLDRIQHKSLTNIYSARVASNSWQYMQAEIASLMDELEQWAIEAMPQVPSIAATIIHASKQRERLLLYFYYQSAKMCITRPCLCRLDQRLKGQSEESARFNQHQADSCIQAALDLTSELAQPRNAQWLYENGPWWSSVHISKFFRVAWSMM